MIDKEQIQAEINNIVQQLKEKYAPEKIILFGSFATGEINDDSDIDLFIVKKEPPKSMIERLHEVEYLIDYKIATDFIVYSPEETEERLKLGDPFVKLIFEEGKVLYG
ncbi:MAG: nucleotidyltransferase domain-containing protein [Elusimicrobiota bacterium]|nr:nucleotidyltransferase domain-containing protein [Elusimicrobiota bacterium]